MNNNNNLTIVPQIVTANTDDNLFVLPPSTTDFDVLPTSSIGATTTTTTNRKFKHYRNCLNSKRRSNSLKYVKQHIRCQPSTLATTSETLAIILPSSNCNNSCPNLVDNNLFISPSPTLNAFNGNSQANNLLLTLSITDDTSSMPLRSQNKSSTSNECSSFLLQPSNLLKVPASFQSKLSLLNTPNGSIFDVSDTNSVTNVPNDEPSQIESNSQIDQSDSLDGGNNEQRLSKMKLSQLDEQIAKNYNLKCTNKATINLIYRSMASSSIQNDYKFETLNVTVPHEFVYHVQFNRPEKRNAMNYTFFSDIKNCFEKLTYESNCRAVVVSGNGKIFTAGLDLTQMSDVLAAGSTEEGADDVGRRGFRIKKTVEDFQNSLSSIEVCPKPVIAAVHSACVGGGVDLISACDIRYCTKDAWFCIKEVDIGLAADIGTLQRFPKIVGNDSLVRELVYTGRNFGSDEAKQLGVVSRVFDDQNELMNAAMELAKLIATKSPIAVQGSKVNLVYSRDHSVEEGLKYISTWNMSNLQSEDLMKAAMGSMQKKPVKFSKL